jgi:hypothetical protein
MERQTRQYSDPLPYKYCYRSRRRIHYKIDHKLDLVIEYKVEFVISYKIEFDFILRSSL